MPATTILDRDGLLIRELAADDIAFLAAMLGDAKTMAFWQRPYTPAEAAQWIADHLARYRRDGFGYWLLIDSEHARPIGQVGLLAMAPRGRPEISLGYILHHSFWGQGYATRASRLCMDYAFTTLGADNLIAPIRPENSASRRLAVRLGFTPGERVDYKGFVHIVYECRSDGREPKATRIETGQGEE